MTIAEIVHRCGFELRQALEASERGDHQEARLILARLFYDLDEWLMRLQEEQAA